MKNNDIRFAAEKIRSEYVKTEETLMDNLIDLHRRVRRPADIFGFVFGTVGALLMGFGLSLTTTNIGTLLGFADPMKTGIIVGVIGIVVSIINVPIYSKILSSRKNKYSTEVINLSDEILNEQ